MSTEFVLRLSYLISTNAPNANESDFHVDSLLISQEYPTGRRGFKPRLQSSFCVCPILYQLTDFLQKVSETGRGVVVYVHVLRDVFRNIKVHSITSGQDSCWTRAHPTVTPLQLGHSRADLRLLVGL